MKLNHVTLLMGAWACLACAEDVDSSAIRTRGMYANYEAVAVGNGETKITAELRVGGDNGTFVELIGDDELTALTDDQDEILRHRNTGNRHYYDGTIDGDDEGLEIQIAFTRGEDDDDAIDSFARLPAPFDADLEDPDENKIERGNDVFIVWDPDANGDMKWSLEGDCIKLQSGSTNDDGSLTIDSDDVEVWQSNVGESCKVTVTLDRVKKGTTDAEFEEGGEFRAIQRRTVTFTSTPADDESDE